MIKKGKFKEKQKNVKEKGKEKGIWCLLYSIFTDLLTIFQKLYKYYPAGKCFAMLKFRIMFWYIIKILPKELRVHRLYLGYSIESAESSCREIFF